MRGRSCLARRPVLTAIIAGLLAMSWVGAEAAEPRPDAPNNRGVVELETGGSAGASIRIAEDLAGLIDDGTTRRVLPVVGRSAMQNIYDLSSLRGVDMAILQADVVDAARQQRTLPGGDNGFTYIAKLYNEELHILARPEIKTVADLAHQKVNVDLRGSGTGTTAGRLFDMLKVPIEPVNDSQELALERLRKGEIAAMAFVAGKPAALFQSIRHDEGLHFVPIPLDAGVVSAYVPTTLTAADYPGLVPEDQAVETIAVGTLLAVANLKPGSERYRNVSNFVDVFFTEFRSLLEPGHHPKWREINLAAALPGLHRFPPAQQWLDRNVAVARQTPQDVKTLFSRFLDTRQQVIGGTPITDQEKQDLFGEFQKWQAGQSH